MALFTLADLHLSLSGEKPMDVFGGNWADFEVRLKENWERVVSEEDTVVVPGDISWAMDLKEAVEDFAFIHSLPGEKILMKGNHDYWWPSKAKLSAFLEENGFHSIRFLQNEAIPAQGKILCGSRGWMCEDRMTEQDEKVLRREALRFGMSLEAGAKLQWELKEAGEDAEIICFSHYPIITSACRYNPILSVLKEYGVKRVYYGHLHNWGTKPLFEYEEGIRFTLVSSDYRSFTPFLID
ncbi:MAG: metallophosphoesterase [Clostridia bacterium]|nr:metallophosphoesterase [Clostridia bacterium]